MLASVDLRTNLYPEVTPVVVRPLVRDSVLLDEVCTLLVVSIVVNLYPESVRVSHACVVAAVECYLCRDKKHVRILYNKTARYLTLAVARCVVELDFLVCLSCLLVSSYSLYNRHSTCLLRRDDNLAAECLCLALCINNLEVVNANLWYRSCKLVAVGELLAYLSTCLCVEQTERLSLRSELVLVVNLELLVRLDNLAVDSYLCRRCVVLNLLVFAPRDFALLQSVRRNGAYTETAVALLEVGYHRSVDYVSCP